MLVRSLSLLAAAMLVSLFLLLALSARQAVFAPDHNPIEEGFFAFDFAAQPQSRPPRQPRAAPRASPSPLPAPDPPGSPSPQLIDVANPIWLSLPRHPERSYPREAFAAGVEGVVDLDCVVETDGRLGCTIASETPPGWGFGGAALALSREHVMAPLVHQGAPARGRYRMRIPFTQPRL